MARQMKKALSELDIHYKRANTTVVPGLSLVRLWLDLMLGVPFFKI